ncbi:CHAT domain-containing protein [Krasilnikovia cinnamomea]|uniref:CHAT domain-containing protein n=1 Tax=Krasilnikovia cinnamomea TaxID=349313 RepID=A0A4Q7ZV89_9ACTN|nr:CHAT domain-containing protein [Krasilnikovia cinnamomea]RZU54505.1 CHAT domain-containing protein [Krasilnikovia cinnamomea]
MTAAPALLSRAEAPSAEAMRLATVQPGHARRLAMEAERAALHTGDWADLSVARRAHGVAAIQLRDLDEAMTQLRGSLSAAQRAGSAQLAGEARMSLASALALRGRALHAFREIDGALRELSGVSAARAMVQRSAILQEMGRVDEALEAVRPALPLLRRFGDAQWETRALSNRSLLHLERRAFAAAETDLLTALRLCERHGLELPRAYVEQNLGCLKASKGEVPAALEFFERAEHRYRGLGLEVGSLLVDRAQVLLAVRLVEEARATAEAAVHAYSKQRRIHLPEARLLLSTVALVEGDLRTAEDAANRAVREFRRQGRHQWLALARHARLQARMVRDPARVTSGQARRSADELAAAGWEVPALEARVIAGRLALERRQPGLAQRDLCLASRARTAGPADVRARAWLAEAMLRRAGGRPYGALRALSAGLRILEEHQATMGATELRAHVSAHRGALARLGVSISLAAGNARGVYQWTERGRAVSVLLRPVHPPADPVLARMLADLRATMTEIDQHRGAGRPTSALVQHQVATERRIRDHCRKAAASGCGGGASPPEIDELAAVLGPAALIEYVELDDELHAVTVVDGRARLTRLGPLTEVHAGLRHLPFALHRMANARTPKVSAMAAAAVLEKVRDGFDRVLMRPLARLIGDRPLVVVPTGPLQSLPWSVLPSCVGRPVTVAPSAARWYRSARRTGAAPSPRVVVVAGPGLPGARDEAEAVAELYPGSVRLFEERADATHVSAAMSGAGLVHVAAHGHLRSDNPLFSALRLADGPYTVYDLELLPSPPHQVVLAACDTGRSHVVAGEEVLGLTAALLSQGTTTLVAPVVPVPDGETAPLMRAYHAQLLAGRTPAEALASAQERTRAQGILPLAAAAGFVCLGAGLA